MSSIINSLSWRAAVKAYDTTKKVSDADLNTILEAGRLAPSSFGLQPWTFVVVTNPEVRAKLRAAAWDQPQVSEASHLIVFARRTDVDAEYVNNFINVTAADKGVTPADLQGLKDMVGGFVQGLEESDLAHWTSEQVHIALGTMITAASELKVDNSPMGGFDKAQFDEILGLKDKNLASVVILALGYRSDEDVYSKAPKSRFPMSEIVVRVK